jgi:mannitol-1-/sugar-/sorbitol-6-phosphatase
MATAIVDCDAILFDMDGTLVDSREVVERQWTRWAARRRVDIAAILAVCHGRPTIDTIRMVAPHLATAAEAATIDAAEALDTDGLRPVRGAPELLASLQHARWAVVTSADRQLATARLKAVGLEVPAVLVTVDDVDRGKPDPAAYVHAARQLSVDPERAIVMEDTPVGIQSGRAAGATVIGVMTTFPALEGCDYCVTDLSAIRAVRNGDGSVQLHVSGSR